MMIALCVIYKIFKINCRPILAELEFKYSNFNEN